MRWCAWLGLVAVIALSACDDDDAEPDGGADAGDGSIPRDAAPPDAGAADGGASDGGLVDGGLVDGGGDGGLEDGGGGGCVAAEVVVAEACPAFGACGGALVEGDYCYDGLCIEEEELLAPLTPYCATIRLEAATGSATGRVSFLAGGEVERASMTALEVRARFPESCVVNTCDEIATLIESQVPGASATCAMTDECRCDVTVNTTVELIESYTADSAAGVLTVGSGPEERRYDYCVDGADGSVRFRDRSAGLTEPGIQSISPAS